jgi:acetyl esterase
MNWFIKHYISREEDLKNQYASPILRTDLSGLPPVLLITAEYDILTNQCNAYAAKLREAGVRVHTKHYPGLIHGFFTLPDAFDAAKESIKQTADELSSSV